MRNKRAVALLAAIAVVVAVIAGFFLFSKSGPSPEGPVVPVAAAPVETTTPAQGPSGETTTPESRAETKTPEVSAANTQCYGACQTQMVACVKSAGEGNGESCTPAYRSCVDACVLGR